ncbi:MAG: hypothetical protein LBG78_02030 [Azoarcus sp.]|jgi:hypothetical protein|nr:hypothetical protein [Azoarcus sp.]
MFLVCIVLVGAWAYLAAPSGEKCRAMWLFGLGLVAALIKIGLFQLTPQWRVIQPDTVSYNLNARAIALHWQGEAVSPLEYKLKGLTGLYEHSEETSRLCATSSSPLCLTFRDWYGDASQETEPPLWRAEHAFSVAHVIGSTDYLYTYYIALWFWLTDVTDSVVIFSNAIWAGFFPVAAFGIALALGASRKVALAAGGLALIDPSAGAVAAWLLKDTLICFVAMSFVYMALRVIREGWKWVPWLVFWAALLSIGRYGAFIGGLCASGAIAVYFIGRRQAQSASMLAVYMLAALFLSGIFFQSLYSGNELNAESILASVEKNAHKISIYSDKVRMGTDDTRDGLISQLKAAPTADVLLVFVKSAVHTLFAPYPWVAIYPGLVGTPSELYYPGVVLWVICLPGIFWAIWQGVRPARFNPVFGWLLLFLFSQFMAYTLAFGEWSTRQRVFALPAFFALAAIGGSDLRNRWRDFRKLKPMLVGKTT